jgi:predicted ester cyclase
MSTAETKEFVRKYLKALSGKPKPASVIDQYVAEQPLKDHILAAEIGFPEYFLEEVEMIAEGDKVAVKARLKGTHLGDFNGIPPTGKKVDLLFHITYQIRDGKIVDHWMLLDSMELLQQLGLMQQQAA